jgi:hypothetical protein
MLVTRDLTIYLYFYKKSLCFCVESETPKRRRKKSLISQKARISQSFLITDKCNYRAGALNFKTLFIFLHCIFIKISFSQKLVAWEVGDEW